jgi:hypothetical protein
MARLTLILGVLATVIYLLYGFRFVLNEWRRWRNKGMWLVMFSLCVVMPSTALAGNWYVRVNGGAYGAEDGTDWTNAYDGFTDIAWASVACGDTIWVAGGTYSTDLNLAKNCTEGSQLYIRRARTDASESTSAAGWDVAFDSLIYMEQHFIIITNNVNWVTISGRSTASPADFGEYGWQISHPDLNGSVNGAVEFGNHANASSNITIEYLDLQGAYSTSYTIARGRGVDDTNSTATSTGHHYSHMRIQGFETAFYFDRTNSPIIEYVEVSDIFGNSPTVHPNLGLFVSSDDGILRYSKVHDTGASGTGFVFPDGLDSNWYLYGNLFYNNSGGSNTVLSIDSGPIDLHILNNTFYVNALNLFIHGPGAACAAGSESKNNIIFGSGGSVACGTTSNNITIASSPDPFVNAAGENFHIVSTTGGSYPRDAGTALTTDGLINYDLDHTQRGADGTWDVGAYEFVSSGTTTPVVIARVMRWMEVAAFVTGMGWHFRKQVMAVSLAAIAGCGTLYQLAPRSYETLKVVSKDSTVKVLTVFNTFTKPRD